MALLRSVRTVDPIAVELAQPDPRQIRVPHPVRFGGEPNPYRFDGAFKVVE
jgi:hypothetical protein